jgi:hypothetical protein
MGRACSKNGVRRNAVGFWWESQKQRDYLEDPEVGVFITVTWILEREDAVVWTGLIWLRIGTIGGLL